MFGLLSFLRGVVKSFGSEQAPFWLVDAQFYLNLPSMTSPIRLEWHTKAHRGIDATQVIWQASNPTFTLAFTLALRRYI